ncbi:MAG: DUF3987 domain-containing protein [Magnetococcales bacterium]|nr:DUF3987 domain-containing protein [Magnetococcales bacterium]
MLTAKQEAFCYAYALNGNASEAYRQAYGANGNPRTVWSEASRLLKNTQIAEQIAMLSARSIESNSQANPLVGNPQVNPLVGNPQADPLVGDPQVNPLVKMASPDNIVCLDFNKISPRISSPMGNRQDIDRIKSRLLERIESALSHLLPAGKTRYGKFYVGDVDGNPGDSMVLELTGPKAGMWFDHATGQGGDIIDLWATIRGWDSRRDFSRILDDIASWLGEFPPTTRPKFDRKTPPVDELGPYTGKWDYHDQAGNLVACVYRYDPPTGKEFRPWDVRVRCWQAPSPRPLYNLPQVIANNRVVMVEGEKCAQALQNIGIVASTAMHGANAPVDKTDWSPLSGKEVLIWPDKDAVGWNFAETTAHACLAAGCYSVTILIPPGDKPEKWDAADAVAEGMNVQAFLATSERQILHAAGPNDPTWPEPTPIAHVQEEPRPYPLDALPDVLRDAAREVARFVKVPVASPAVIGLSVAALAIGKKARIQERPGLYHHPALFHALIAASGERKSPPFKIMTHPLELWIEGALDAYQQRVAEAATNNQVLDTVLNALKKQATKPNMTDEEQQTYIKQMAKEECKRVTTPPHPRMFTSDATEERLFQRMHTRGGEYSVLSGEGRPVFDAIMGKYSGKERTGDAIYLAGISGDTITRDRVGNENGPEDRMIVNPCLNVCIMVQPDKYLEAARHPSLRASGALARIWPVWLPSLVGTRLEEVNEFGLNEFILQPYEEIILGLLNAKAPEKNGKPECHLVKLSSEAKESRRQWHNTVEMQMAEGRDLEDVRDIASKAVSATVKAALVLHLLERPQLLKEEESELGLATWERAKMLGEYHLEEAVRVQRMAEGDALEAAALRVARWALKSGNMEFSIRTLGRSLPRPRLAPKDAEAVLEFMIDLNWVRRIPVERGQRAVMFQLNPMCASCANCASAPGVGVESEKSSFGKK